MNLYSFSPMIKAALMAIIVAVVGWTGLNIPQSTVEQTVDAQLDVLLERVTASETADVPAAGVIGVSAQVTHVVDGDTARVLIDGQEVTLRFIGIDTPETKHSPAGAECYGDTATERATQLLAGQTVTLTSDPTQATRDVHDRLLVYAQLPTGQDFGEVMIAEGFAYEYTYAAAYANQAVYQTAEAAAQADQRGLWAACQ